MTSGNGGSRTSFVGEEEGLEPTPPLPTISLWLCNYYWHKTRWHFREGGLEPPLLAPLTSLLSATDKRSSATAAWLMYLKLLHTCTCAYRLAVRGNTYMPREPLRAIFYDCKHDDHRAPSCRIRYGLMCRIEIRPCHQSDLAVSARWPVWWKLLD